jgi:hypothetical protein
MDFEDPALGKFRFSVPDRGWLGRLGDGARFSDLIVRADNSDEEPSTAALETLRTAVRDLPSLTKIALAHVRKFRREQLNFNEGPPDHHWSVESIITDQSGKLVLVLYEADTDEYSAWHAHFAAATVTITRERA